MGTILSHDLARSRHPPRHLGAAKGSTRRHILALCVPSFSGGSTLTFAHLPRRTFGPSLVPKKQSCNRDHVTATLLCLAWVQKTAQILDPKCAQILGAKSGPPDLKLHCRPSHVHTHFLDQNTVSFCSSFLILHFRICPQWHGPMPIMKIRTKEKPSTTATTKASQYSKALRTTLGGQPEETH